MKRVWEKNGKEEKENYNNLNIISNERIEKMMKRAELSSDS